MKRFGRGLVVGKFCPLHKGHELLINEAISQCEVVTVLTYTSEPYGYSMQRRIDWIKTVCPSVFAVIGADNNCPQDSDPAEHHRDFCAQMCDILKFKPDAVFTSEDYGDGFAQRLSDWVRKPVEHVCVDKARLLIPISGTELRNDPSIWDLYTSAYVKKTRALRVLLIGGESSGKTALAQRLAEVYGVPWVPEYGRELWEFKDGKLTFEDMLDISREQVLREQEALSKTMARYVFCDTSPLVTQWYSQAMFGNVDPQLIELAKRRYDVILMCDRDFEFVNDGTRQDARHADDQQKWYTKMLTETRQPFHVVSGSVMGRTMMVYDILGEYK